MSEKEYHSKKNKNVQALLTPPKTFHFASIPSTNTWAKENYHQWSPQGLTLITADGQTGGRGRFKRRWESPVGVNIYATFCFWIDVDREDIGHIPQLLALSTALILERHRFSPAIKWPNDVLLNQKKIAGILCETIIEGLQLGIICGIGLNVNMTQSSVDQIDRPATSLMLERGSSFDSAALLHELQQEFTLSLLIFLEQGFSPFFPLFKHRSAFQKGEAVRFHNNQILIEGIFEALHPDGSVELKMNDGTFNKFISGEFIN